MKAIHILAVMGLVLGLGACGNSDPASRNVSPGITDLSVASKNATLQGAYVAQYNVAQVQVLVPRTLKVSEANMFFPLADIVWREDPRGDRYTQVASVVQQGLELGTRSMVSGQSIVVQAEVTRFHALTEKTRYTIGGVHSVHFLLTVRDAGNGAIIDGPRPVAVDVKGAGGAQAIAEEQAGRTQRVVITEALADVIRKELSRPITAPLLSEVPLSQFDSAVQMEVAALSN